MPFARNKLIYNLSFYLLISYRATRINPLNAQLNPICNLLALLGTHPILHVSRIGVNVECA
jgi:hypothetical protein